MARRPAPWRRHARGVCPGCRRVVGALRSPATGNLLLREHHRPRTHVVCTPARGRGVGSRWWGLAP
jgi:hypothetical protein